MRWLVPLLFVGWMAACVGDDPAPSSERNIPDANASDSTTSSDQDTGTGVPPDDDGSVPDATTPACDTSKRFGAPSRVLGLPPRVEVTLDAAELEATVTFPNTTTNKWELHSGTRSSRTAAFGPLKPHVRLNSASWTSRGGTISPDGSTMLFFSDRVVDGVVRFRLWASKRANLSADFPEGAFEAVTDIPEPNVYYPQWLSDRTVLIGAYSPGRLYRATWNGTDFTAAVRLAELEDFQPRIARATHDEALIVFDSAVGGVSHLYEARRNGATFGAPRRLDELAADAGGETVSWLSSDGCRIYFTGTPNGDVLVAERPR